MLLSIDLTNIENKYNLPPLVIQGVQKELLALRPSDTLTKNKLARAANVDIDFAETLLVELFKEKYLQVVIRVECTYEDGEHYTHFNSFEDFYKAKSEDVCGSCGSAIDWKNAKIAFKRGIYR